MSDDFDWNGKDVAIPNQDAIAVYANKGGSVTIRFFDSDNREDHWVSVAPEYISSLCRALHRARKEAMADRNNPVGD